MYVGSICTALILQQSCGYMCVRKGLLLNCRSSSVHYSPMDYKGLYLEQQPPVISSTLMHHVLFGNIVQVQNLI